MSKLFGSFTKKSGVLPRFAILLVLLLVMGSFTNLAFNGFSLTGDSGYSSGFQNPRARFYGIRYEGNNYVEGNEAAVAQFDTVLRFDPDERNGGKPDLVGEMTSVYIPKESLGAAAWVPTEWLNHGGYIENPQQVYDWNISGKSYHMEQWVLRWYVSFSVDWQSLELPFENLLSGSQNVYSATDAWVEFNLTPNWYIAGQGQAYFAIGKMQLAETAIYGGETVSGQVETPRDAVSVSPESQGAIEYIYYAPWGGSPSERSASSYQGKTLNPDLFTDKVYCRIGFNNFGVESRGWLGGDDVGDTVKLAFDVTVFVIGEWDVQDIQENPEDFGRFVRINEGFSLSEFVQSPYFWLGVAVLVIVVLALFAPWVLMALVNLLTSLTSGRKK